MNDRVIAIEGAYSIQEVDVLKSLFDKIIPASADNRFPSAADPQIFEDFLASSGRFREMISRAIILLQELSGLIIVSCPRLRLIRNSTILWQ